MSDYVCKRKIVISNKGFSSNRLASYVRHFRLFSASSWLLLVYRRYGDGGGYSSLVGSDPMRSDAVRCGN